MVAVVMGHDIQDIQCVTEHTDNRTVHLNRSFLLKTEYGIIAVSVKKKTDLDFWMCLSKMLSEI